MYYVVRNSAFWSDRSRFPKSKKNHIRFRMEIESAPSFF